MTKTFIQKCDEIFSYLDAGLILLLLILFGFLFFLGTIFWYWFAPGGMAKDTQDYNSAIDFCNRHGMEFKGGVGYYDTPFWNPDVLEESSIGGYCYEIVDGQWISKRIVYHNGIWGFY